MKIAAATAARQRAHDGRDAAEALGRLVVEVIINIMVLKNVVFLPRIPDTFLVEISGFFGGNFSLFLAEISVGLNFCYY